MDTKVLCKHNGNICFVLPWYQVFYECSLELRFYLLRYFYDICVTSMTFHISIFPEIAIKPPPHKLTFKILCFYLCDHTDSLLF